MPIGWYFRCDPSVGLSVRLATSRAHELLSERSKLFISLSVDHNIKSDFDIPNEAFGRPP